MSNPFHVQYPAVTMTNFNTTANVGYLNTQYHQYPPFHPRVSAFDQQSLNANSSDMHDSYCSSDYMNTGFAHLNQTLEDMVGVCFEQANVPLEARHDDTPSLNICSFG
eukprot:Gb_11791 [translate_table: standard]